MTRVRKLILLGGAALTLPFTVVRGEVVVNDAQCEGGSGATTCCIQVIAACNTLHGYYDKGCGGKCDEPCP